jgi:hypothetical protein
MVIAGQLADPTRAVEQMANQLEAVRERANTQQETNRPRSAGTG